jgi:hypothetical protein
MSTPTLLPFARHELIPPGSNDPTIVPVGNVFHVAVSESADLHDYFSGPSGGIESHGYIRRDGSVIQYRTLDREADAQAAGNSFTYQGKLCGFLSWETQGMGPGEWTPDQVATIRRIMQWTHDHLGTPLGQAPAWNRPGNGYHSLFPEWNPNKHSCPGPDRIRQWPSIVNGKDALDMATPEEVAQAVQHTKLSNGGYIGWNIADTRERVARIEKALSALASGISPTVEAAVRDALTEATVQVDVNVNGVPK